MAGRVNPNGPTRSRALLPPAMLGLGLLAAMAGHASAELGCSDPRDSGYGYSYLSDTEYCHITELNAAFDGRLTGCDGDGLVRRVCSQMCTHHHPPTPTHTHSVGRACAPLLLLSPLASLFPLSLSLCVNESKKEKRDCDTARLSWPRDEWHHSAPAFRHAWLLHEAEHAVNSPSNCPRPP